MYLYDFQALGQQAPTAPPIVSVVNGVQQLSPNASQLLQTLFQGKYPRLTGSYKTATGVTAPAFDPTADVWGYHAVSTPEQAGGVSQTVYAQLQSMTDKSLFLVDVPSAQAAINGAPTEVVYAIAKDQVIASQMAAPGASFARLIGPTTTTAPTTKPKTNVAPIVAGISALALLALIAAA